MGERKGASTSMPMEFYSPSEKLRDPVFLLPGLGGGSWLWHDAATALAAQGHPVAVLSDAFGLHPEVHRHARLVEEVDAVLRDTFSEPVVLAGNSLGGLIATEIAAARPEMVSALILTGSAGLGEEPLPLSSAQLHTVSKSFAVEQAKRFFFHNEALVTPELADRAYRPFLHASSRQKLAMLRSIRSTRDYDARHLFSAITAPTLLVWGSEDHLTPAAWWRDAPSYFRRCRYAEISAVGHSPMFEKPVEFVALVTAFLDEVSGGNADLAASATERDK
jgi:2-hydroxy-6-oxonona-2,4-dienedioate hydrolase